MTPLTQEQMKILELLALPHRFYRNATVYEGPVVGGEAIPVTPEYELDSNDFDAIRLAGFVSFQEDVCPGHSEYVINETGRNFLECLEFLVDMFNGDV